MKMFSVRFYSRRDWTGAYSGLTHGFTVIESDMWRAIERCTTRPDKFRGQYVVAVEIEQCVKASPAVFEQLQLTV